MLLLDDSVTSLAEASNETNLRYHCTQVIVRYPNTSNVM